MPSILRSPLVPWYKINFLNFDEVGDHKVTWELNRHQHLVKLAQAWLFTREERYVQEAIAQWYSWQRANPFPLGANWASSLEVGFRSLSWIWFQHLSAKCPAVPASFHKDLHRALALNGRYIERYLSTYFSPNTHLLGEAVVLFFLGTLYPQIQAAGRWKKKGWRIVQEEAVKQVRPDGVYFEQSLYYHVYALDFFLHAHLLASRNDMEIPGSFDLVLRRMLLVVKALAAAGTQDGFGDDDGGRVFNPRRNRAEHLTDPLAIGAALFQDQELGASLTAESIWLFGEQALSLTAAKKNPVPKTQSFPDGGLYIAASSAPPEQIVIDAGPQGTGRSGHGHADALSIELSSGGNRWLVDAGTYCYIGPGDERNAFRGTRAHNTLTVDGLDQADPEGPFAWSAIPTIHADLWIPGHGFTLFEGSHSGYERLGQPVRHRRFVFHLNGQFSLIRDVAEGSGSHLLETSWHFAPGTEVSQRTDSFLAARAAGAAEKAERMGHLRLIPAADPDWKSELRSEFVSPAYGEKVSAPVVCCSARVNLPAEHAVLLIPGDRGEGAQGKFFRNDAGQGNVKPSAVYQYQQDGTAHAAVFRGPDAKPWHFGPWTSDAQFFYFCVKNRRLEHLLFCKGDFVQLEGVSLIRHDASIQWLEWTSRQGHDRFTCSDESAAGSFSEDVLGREIVI